MLSILFICTGNTCRSPMAEGFMKKLLQERNNNGFSVASAGTAAFDGDSISDFAAIAMQEQGIDMSTHHSRGITHELLAGADYIVTMTEAQKHTVAAYCDKQGLYCMKDFLGIEITDPFGGSQNAYFECAAQIEEGLKIFYGQILESGGSKMRIPVAADHAAFLLKERVLAYLQELGYEPVDMGCYSSDSVNYPDFGAKVAAAVSSGEYEKGILICGTGIGMSMVANKFPHIRAALCHNEFTAQASREHNDANILVMGARIVSEEEALHITDIWLKTEFAGGRHALRLEKIAELEKQNFK